MLVPYMCDTHHRTDISAVCEAQDQQTCPSFGEDSARAVRPYSTEEKLYLNIKETSQCNGTVTGWNFCFYNAKTSQGVDSLLGVKFIVYRRTATSRVFTAVPNSMYDLGVNGTDLPMQGCSNVTLSQSQQFQILENDIIAACVLDNKGGIFPLFVTSSESHEAIQIRQDGYEMCTDDQLSTINLNSLHRGIRNTLHLHAILGK